VESIDLILLRLLNGKGMYDADRYIMSAQIKSPMLPDYANQHIRATQRIDCRHLSTKDSEKGKKWYSLKKVKSHP
jgi:hypothetical protein